MEWIQKSELVLAVLFTVKVFYWSCRALVIFPAIKFAEHAASSIYPGNFEAGSELEINNLSS